MSTPTPTPAPNPPALDFKNIQGDILGGLPKKAEVYFFFRVEDAQVKAFRTQLAGLLPLITTTAQVMGDRAKIQGHKKNDANKWKLLKLCGVNISFSQKGLEALGFSSAEDRINDAPFEGGMINDSALNDQPEKWLPEFRQDIHGLITVAGDSKTTVDSKLEEVQKILKGTMQAVKTVEGHVRPGKEEGHEHFGYLDGISQPAVLGVNESTARGQESVRQGIILLGREGDVDTNGDPIKRPPWALDGSFLTFRYLSQLVPEFQAFVDANNPPGAPKDLLGARLVGRWKSGAPIDLTPLKDNPSLGTDPNSQEDFRYDPLSQDRCPFAAHTRKTNPRSDLPSTEVHRILRRGIQFGPEVTEEEKSKGTIHERGLLFKSFSSNNVNGFQFIQSSWANNVNFPFLKATTAGLVPKPDLPKDKGPGFDSIIGQAKNGAQRDIQLTNTAAGALDLPVDWVVPKGGEYFFTPSIPALRTSVCAREDGEGGALK